MLSETTRARVKRFGGSAPRYTSYPTAPHFSATVQSPVYRRMLGALNPQDRVSVYVHVPFCGSLCWFCACRSQGVRSYRPVASYLNVLLKELGSVAAITPARRLAHLHWGGGSPTILDPDDIRRLARACRDTFDFEPEAEFAVEIDPRDMSEARLDALAEVGVTRASLGVQDFDTDVQAAINRFQSFEMTRAIVGGLRNRGVAGVNIDALYGLPRQTLEGVRETAEKTIAINPDRIALFGYAHVPWMAKRQKLISDNELPEPELRFEMAETAAEMFVAAGYRRVGLDHFAKLDDPLAIASVCGTLRRNFQGYTSDQADALIGVGASAISRTRLGFAQNAAATPAYAKAIEESGLAVERGRLFSEDDLVRGYAIERLMCDLRFDFTELKQRFGALAEPLGARAIELMAEFPKGLLRGSATGFEVTEEGRPFVRNVAMAFDAYVADSAARYSRAV